MKKEVTVGILLTNEYTDLDNLFKSLHTETDYIKEVIVIANNIDDIGKLHDIIGDHISKFKISVRYFKFNTGCAGGRNKLIKFCKTKYMLICDADLTVTDDLVKILFGSKFTIFLK